MKSIKSITVVAAMLGIAEFQVRNLAILAMFHKSGKSDGRVRMLKFHSSFSLIFVGPQESAKELEHGCGSAGCLLGWGPSAGIISPTQCSWETYSRDQFGVQGYEDVFQYIFGFFQANCPYKGADRIAKYLCGFKPSHNHMENDLDNGDENAQIDWDLVESLAQ